MGDLLVGEAELLGAEEVEVGELGAFVCDFLEVVEEPAVNLGGVEDFLDGPAVLEGDGEPEDALGVGDVELALDVFAVDVLGVFAVEAESEAAGLEGAEGLLHGLLEGAADGHGFADGLHLGGEDGVGGGELFESEAGELGDDVVDGGLEAGGSLAGDVVGKLVHGVSDGELGGDFGDGESGGFGGEGGGARDAWVHLDDDDAAVGGIDRELDVGASGLDADFANAGEGLVAHDLVFAVGEGLCGGDGDGVAGVDAHGVEVLDGANDDAVVGAVAHDFHLVFLPAEEAFFDEDFVNGGEVDAAGADFFELFFVVGDATAAAAEGEGGANDEGHGADLFRDFAGVFHAVGDAGVREVEADLEHGFLESEAVFALVDGISVRANHADVVLVEGAAIKEVNGGVEGGLATESGEEGIGLFRDDDALDEVWGDGLDEDAVGGLRVGHDGGRVGVDEDDLVAFFAQGFAGLGAGVIEFTTLSDDDGSGTDNEDLFNRGVFGHKGCWLNLGGTANWGGKGQALSGIFGRNWFDCE